MAGNRPTELVGGLDLVLASTSRYRAEQLHRLGLSFRTLAPTVDEEACKRDDDDPRQRAERLARLKAESLSSQEPQATLIGGDQVVAAGGQIFGKPGTRERAVDQLAFLSGRTHELITALAVWHRGRMYCHTDVTALRMRTFERAALTRYVDAERPLDCAGAYKFESRGIALFESVTTEDASAIQGLPLIALTTILRSLGYSIP